jgi:hypothetical protein
MDLVYWSHEEKIAMLEDQFEERLDALTKRVEELSTEVETLKKERAEESGLIPGAEYDFVPTVAEKIIGRYTIRVGKTCKADSLLGLTDEEWRLYSTPDEV